MSSVLRCMRESVMNRRKHTIWVYAATVGGHANAFMQARRRAGERARKGEVTRAGSMERKEKSFAKRCTLERNGGRLHVIQRSGNQDSLKV